LPASPPTTALPPFVDALPGGVFAVDTGYHRDRFDAAWLVVEQGRAAFIDTGTNHALPRLLAALQALGLGPEAVDLVIPTHVHLDHAGGAGQLMQHLPNAQLWVHPRGLRHLVDPAALVAGATAVYGAERVLQDYGVVQPVPADRAHATHDGQVLMLAGRALVVADTPGHARHHHCVWDEATRGWFTGDTFGLSYRELDTPAGPWILPTSTPVQFEPEALAASIRRLLAQQPQRIYLTHYGCVGAEPGTGGVPRLGALLLELLDGMVALAHRVHAHEPDPAARHQALKAAQLDLFAASLQAQGSALTRAEVARFLDIDLELNAQGIAVWLDRLDRPPR
jgi:glyoxylase-like metal-dependent hydrolase (beta-lactamase superfamily II)